MRLPAVAGPSIGINSTCADLPDPGKTTRPCVDAETKGVSIQNPGRVTSPSDATVVPSSRSAVGSDGAAAASSRSAAVVVSKASAVRAPAGGGGARNRPAGRALGRIVGCVASDVAPAASAPSGALGAKGTYIGRAFLYGLGAMGQAGVTKALEIIQKEMDITMALCGCRDIEDFSKEHLIPKDELTANDYM